MLLPGGNPRLTKRQSNFGQQPVQVVRVRLE